MREPRAGDLRAERGGDQLVRGGEGQVGGKEAEAAGDEILVGGHRGGMRGVVPVGESDQRRGIDERDIPRDLIVSLRLRPGDRSVVTRRSSPRERAQIGESPSRDVAAAAAADGDHIAQRIGVAARQAALEIGAVSPPQQERLGVGAVDEPLPAQPAARQLPSRR